MTATHVLLELLEGLANAVLQEDHGLAVGPPPGRGVQALADGVVQEGGRGGAVHIAGGQRGLGGGGVHVQRPATHGGGGGGRTDVRAGSACVASNYRPHRSCALLSVMWSTTGSHNVRGRKDNFFFFNH